MNRIYLTLAVSAIFCMSAAYGQDNGSTLHFDDQSWNFGTIAETDGKVSHRFEFTNTGTAPLIIESASVSCGCTSPSYPRDPVMPGKKSYIEVTYDPTNRPGFFLNKIIVKSGKGRNTNTISITGTVTPRPRPVEQEYPFKMQQGIRFSVTSVDFNRVGQGQSRSVTVGYINTSQKDAELKIVPAETHPWFRIISPGKVYAGRSGEITFTIDLTKTILWGVQTIPVDIYINGVKQGQRLVVSALATDNFDGPAVASGARSKLDAQFFHFGNVNADVRSLSHEFTIGNEGTTPLVVRAVQYGDGIAATLREGAVVEPGGTMRFTVTIDLDSGDLTADRVIRSLKLVMNDPIRPVREIRMAANIHR